MKMRKRWLAIGLVFLGLVLGCSAKPPGAAEFVQITIDHQRVCAETCDALTLSIQQELDERKDLPDAQVVAYLDLIERLKYVKSSAALIQRYTIATMVDEDLMVEMLKVRIWGENYLKYGIKRPGEEK